MSGWITPELVAAVKASQAGVPAGASQATRQAAARDWAARQQTPGLKTIPSVHDIATQIGRELYKPPELKPEDLVKLPDGYMLKHDYQRLSSEDRAAAKGGGFAALNQLHAKNLEADFHQLIKIEGSWQVANKALPTDRYSPQEGTFVELKKEFKKLDNQAKADLVIKMSERAIPGVGHSQDIMGAIFKGRLPTKKEYVGMIPVVGTVIYWNQMSAGEKAVSLLIDAAIVGAPVARPVSRAIFKTLGVTRARNIASEMNYLRDATRTGNPVKVQEAGARITRLGEAMRAEGVPGAEDIIRRGRIVQINAPDIAKGTVSARKLTKTDYKAAAKRFVTEESGEVALTKRIGKPPRVTKKVDVLPLSREQARRTGLSERMLREAHAKGKTEAGFWREVKRLQANKKQIDDLMAKVDAKLRVERQLPKGKPARWVPTRRRQAIDIGRYVSKAERDRAIRQTLSRMKGKTIVRPKVSSQYLTWAVAADAAAVFKDFAKMSPAERSAALAKLSPALRSAVQTNNLTAAKQLAKTELSNLLASAATKATAQAKAEGATATEAKAAAKEATQVKPSTKPGAAAKEATQVKPSTKPGAEPTVGPGEAGEAVKTPVPKPRVSKPPPPKGPPPPPRDGPPPKKPRHKIIIPPPPIPPPPGTEKAKLTLAQRKGAIGWKQGFIYKAIYPPYGVGDIINSRGRIPGIKYAAGAKSAFLSIARITKGRIPPALARDMGIMDIRISTPVSGKPRIRFTADPKQKTRLTPAGAGRLA